jgi:hypothetical protein
MKNKRIYIVAVAVLVLLALFLRTFSPSPLPEPKPYAGPLPSATPPKGMAVFALVAGVNTSSCGLWLSRRVVVRATRIFDGRSFGEAPPGRPAHRYWFWP